MGTRVRKSLKAVLTAPPRPHLEPTLIAVRTPAPHQVFRIGARRYRSDERRLIRSVPLRDASTLIADFRCRAIGRDG